MDFIHVPEFIDIQSCYADDFAGVEGQPHTKQRVTKLIPRLSEPIYMLNGMRETTLPNNRYSVYELRKCFFANATPMNPYRWVLTFYDQERGSSTTRTNVKYSYVIDYMGKNSTTMFFDWFFRVLNMACYFRLNIFLRSFDEMNIYLPASVIQYTQVIDVCEYMCSFNAASVLQIQEISKTIWVPNFDVGIVINPHFDWDVFLSSLGTIAAPNNNQTVMCIVKPVKYPPLFWLRLNARIDRSESNIHWNAYLNWNVVSGVAVTLTELSPQIYSPDINCFVKAKRNIEDLQSKGGVPSWFTSGHTRDNVKKHFSMSGIEDWTTPRSTQPKSCAESTSWQGFSPHDAQSIVALKIRPVFSFDDYARLQSIWATQQSEIQAHQEKKSIIESTLSDDPQAPASSSTNSGPECGICYEPITITTARVLVCSHGFCSKCINLMFDNIMAVEEDGSKIIICPICRNQTAHMTADTIGKIFWSV